MADIIIASMRRNATPAPAGHTPIRVDRSSPLGNPFRMKNESERNFVIQQYRSWLWEQMQSDTPAHRELKRITNIARTEPVALLCWCTPKPCHADVIKRSIQYLLKHGEPA